MATLIVRQVDEQVVEELKERARRAGRSAEAEHRLILNKALQRRSGSGAELWKRLVERSPNLDHDQWVKADQDGRAAVGRPLHPDQYEEAEERDEGNPTS